MNIKPLNKILTYSLVYLSMNFWFGIVYANGIDNGFIGKRVVVTTPIRFNDNCTKLDVTSNGKWKTIEHCIPASIVNEHILYFTRDNIFYFVDKDRTGNGQGVVLSKSGGSGSKVIGSNKYTVKVSANKKKLKAEMKVSPLSRQDVAFEWKLTTAIRLQNGKCTAKSRLNSSKASINSSDLKYYRKGRGKIFGREICSVKAGR